MRAQRRIPLLGSENGHSRKETRRNLEPTSFTAAHTYEFQAILCDTHPRHYNDDYAKAHGMPAALIQPFQVLALTAPGVTLFTPLRRGED